MGELVSKIGGIILQAAGNAGKRVFRYIVRDQLNDSIQEDPEVPKEMKKMAEKYIKPRYV